MTRIKVSFNAQLAADFVPVAANDNDKPKPAIQPLEAEDITDEVEMAVAQILAERFSNRRDVPNRVVKALYTGPFDVRYGDGSYFLRGYDIDDDLSSDWTFTWLRDLQNAANDNGPLPPLTDLMKRRLNLIILWFYVEAIDRGERIGVSPRPFAADHKKISAA